MSTHIHKTSTSFLLIFQTQGRPLPPLNLVVYIPQSLPQILNRGGRVFLPGAGYVFDRVPQAEAQPFVVDKINDFDFSVRIVGGMIYIV
jgi:hypothetical protein